MSDMQEHIRAVKARLRTRPATADPLSTDRAPKRSYSEADLVRARHAAADPATDRPGAEGAVTRPVRDRSGDA